MPQNTEIEIDLLKILKSCLKKAWLIILAAAILGGGMFVYQNNAYVPSYTTSTTLYASYTNARDFAFGENTGNISQSSLGESRSIVNTCTAVLNTRMTLEAVIEEAGVETSVKDLKDMVSAAAVNGSEVFTVTVNGTDPEEIIALANAFAKVLPEQVSMINSSSTIGVIDEAVEATVANSNDAVKDAAVAAVLGAFLVCAVVAVQCIVEDFKAAKAKNQ